jgi:two-component system OmpR family response regulator
MLALLTETDGGPDASLSLSDDGRHAYIFGEKIKLTEVEYKLLEVILKADGFVSKEQILDTVWGDGYDLGVVNVYVHYLRRKLEKGGNKVIISSRNEGYRIDEKYRRKS